MILTIPWGLERLLFILLNGSNSCSNRDLGDILDTLAFWPSEMGGDYVSITSLNMTKIQVIKSKELCLCMYLKKYVWCLERCSKLADKQKAGHQKTPHIFRDNSHNEENRFLIVLFLEIY